MSKNLCVCVSLIDWLVCMQWCVFVCGCISRAAEGCKAAEGEGCRGLPRAAEGCRGLPSIPRYRPRIATAPRLPRAAEGAAEGYRGLPSALPSLLPSYCRATAELLPSYCRESCRAAEAGAQDFRS